MKSKGTFRRLFSYLRPHRLRLTLVFFMGILATLFTVVAPSVLGGITTQLYNGVSTGVFDWDMILILLAALVVLYLVSQAFAYVQSVGMNRVMARTMESLRQDISGKMHRLRLDYYDTHTHGEILSTITNDVDSLGNALSQNLTQIVTQVITAVGILVMMLRLSPALAAIAIVMVPIALLASSGVMRSGAKYYGQQQELMGEMNGFIEEMYQGQSLVQTYNHQNQAKEDFDRLNARLTEAARNAESASGKVNPITDLVNNLGYVLSAVLGCLSVLNGNMRIGDVQAMLQYTKQFSQPFTTIAGMAGSFCAARAAAGRIFALLDAEEETPDPENGKVPEHCDGSVEFRHVRFGYRPDRPLMKDVNLTVKPGQKVAIVGPTGAGKTTLINLLLRFYEIDEGAILVNGVDTREMSRQELRRHFGMVLQDTWLFEGSIRDNIAYSKEDMPEETVLAAAEAASVAPFVRTLPGGYELRLTHGAENISQGQRQLITIARAMAADPEIMILDEATSNVDTHTEQLIQQAMAELMRHRTSFIIANRLSTIRDADVILYMENGDIKEMGNHESLMALHGKYEALYQSQFV